MLVTRDGLHPALVDLFVDASREIYGEQGFFRGAGEFPGTTQVDLRVSPEADRHKHFGPRFLYQYLPFWVAAIVERAIIILLPLAAVLFHSSTTCLRSCAGAFDHVSIAGTVSWPCWSAMLKREQDLCPWKSGSLTWTELSVPSCGSTHLLGSPVKRTRFAGTSTMFAAPY
jgi:hypothetical protein